MVTLSVVCIGTRMSNDAECTNNIATYVARV